MATTPVQSSNAFQDLATALMKTADSNQDGSLSSAEFTGFLSRMLGNMSGFRANTAGGPTGGSGTVKAGSGSGRLLGFDANKLANPAHNTVKYMFGRVAQNYDASSIRSKTDAEAMLNSMRAELEAAGITVLGITGDKIRVLDDAGQEAVVDVVQGASSGAGGWQWIDTRF